MIEWTAGGYISTSYGLRPFDIGELDMEYFKDNLGTEENVIKLTCEIIIHLYSLASICIMLWKVSSDAWRCCMCAFLFCIIVMS